MLYKFFISTLIISSLPFLGYSQLCKEYLDIKKSENSLEKKQYLFCDFFEENEEYMNARSLADHFHDYGVWYYRIWLRTKEDKLFDQCVWYTKKALAIKRVDQLGSKSFRKTLYNLGAFHFENNNFFEAILLFLELVELGEIDARTKSAYLKLGRSYRKIGDYYKAISNINKAIVLYENDLDFRLNLIDAHIRMTGVYFKIDPIQFSDSIASNLLKSDSLIKVISLKNSFIKSQIHQLRGNTLVKRQYYEKAILSFEKSISGLEEDTLNQAISYNSIGHSYLKLKDYDQALHHLKKSISYDPYYGSAYNHLGDYYIENKEFIRGLYNYEKAIETLINKKREIKYDNLITKEDLKIVIKKYHLLRFLVDKANAWIKYYKYDQNKNHLVRALETFRIADLLVDIIRFESSEYKSKLFWREKGASLYMKAVEACYLLDKPDEAYYFMEKNKAVLLLEDITNEQAKENAKLPVAMARREFMLKKEIYLAENDLNTASNQFKDRIEQLKDKLYVHKRVYEKFVDSLQQTYPDYAVKKEKLRVLPYDAFITNYTSKKEAVLHYIFNDEQGYGVVHAGGAVVFFEIKDVVNLQENILLLRKQSTQWFSDQEQLRAFQGVSNQVFNRLLPPDIYQRIQGKNLTIIPDYTLQQLSFETLVTDTVNQQYVIVDTEIRYAYSMTYLDRNRQIQRNPTKGFIGFAPVTFATDELSELTYSEDEITTIAKNYQGDVLLDKDAIKSNFLDTIHNYQIIHLSTHANAGNVVHPWIAFKDKKLSLNEIYATKNQSDMVVLSACKTAQGELKKGEGVMSLARGFFHAGTKSVVSSLWATNDKSNQELMIDFYKGLNNGLTKSAALRKAKLNYMNSHQGSELSPFYWGSLVLIGDNATLSLAADFSIWYWLGGLGLGVFLVIFSVLYIHRKKLKEERG